MTVPFGHQNEHFKSSLFLVLMNRLMTCFVAIACLLVRILSSGHLIASCHDPGDFMRCHTCLAYKQGVNHAAHALQWTKESLAPVAPAYAYAAVSLSNVVATTCQYEALKYVTFPLQTLGKTAKMIPVMLWGSLIGGKR